MNMPSINIFIIDKPPKKEKEGLKIDKRDELIKALMEDRQDNKNILRAIENLPTGGHAGGG